MAFSMTNRNLGIYYAGLLERTPRRNEHLHQQTADAEPSQAKAHLDKITLPCRRVLRSRHL